MINIWEWRIFTEFDILKHLPPELHIYSEALETRTDYYYDFGHDQFGLKERLSEGEDGIFPKLELKVRLATHRNGAEYWVKVMSHEFPQLSTHLPFFQVEDIIEEEIAQSEEYFHELSDFYKLMSDDFQVTAVEKSRCKIKLLYFGEIVKVEYVRGSINDEIFYGFTIESENIDVVQSLVNKWNLKELEPKTGYPGFISLMNS